MKRSSKIAVGIAAALGLGLGAGAVIAHPGSMGEGPHDKAGMQHSKMGGMQHGAMGQGAAGTGAGHSAMTPEERQKLAQSRREAMQKHAKEKGITLPQHGGSRHTH